MEISWVFAVRIDVSQSRVASAGIVPALDKLEDGHFCFSLGFERPAVQELGFECGEETPAHRIVVGITDGAH